MKKEIIFNLGVGLQRLLIKNSKDTIFEGVSYCYVQEIDKVKKLILKLHKIHEKYCNGAIEEQKYDEKVKKLKQKIKHQINELSVWMDVKVLEFQSDPRGATTRLNHWFIDDYVWGS